MQVAPSIHAIRHSFRVPVAPGIFLDRFVHSFLIDGETTTLIDTGVAGCEGEIFESLRSCGRDPSDIGLIILTHSHPDHIGAARTIQQLTRCRIAAHPAERAWIEDVNLQNRDRPVPGFDTLVSGSVHVDHILADGDILLPHTPRLGEMQVLHTPGHSPGSISLFFPLGGILFSGDAIPVPGDLPIYDDALLSMQSVQRLRRLAGVRVLLSSWEDPVRDGEAYRQMDGAAVFLQRIHDAVRAAAIPGSPDLMEITRSAAAAIGLPAQAVTSMLARTVDAHLRIRDRQSLREDFP